MTISPETWPENVFVLIPSYQSAGPLRTLLKGLTSMVPAKNVCVVDDASRDGTDRVCAETRVGYIGHPENQGKGASLADGFRRLIDRCNAQWVLTLDADGQHAVEDIPAFIHYIGRFPYVGVCIGVRSLTPAKMPLFRILSNMLTSWMLSLLAGQSIPDSQCGFRIYSARLLQRVSCVNARFEMESEILLKAARLRFPIGHVKVQTLYFNGASHIRLFRDTLRWIRSIMRVWLELRKP